MRKGYHPSALITLTEKCFLVGRFSLAISFKSLYAYSVFRKCSILCQTDTSKLIRFWWRLGVLGLLEVDVFPEQALCSWCGFRVKVVDSLLLFVAFLLRTFIATYFPWKIISVIYTISFINTISHTFQVSFIVCCFCKWCSILTYRKVKRPHLHEEDQVIFMLLKYNSKDYSHYKNRNRFWIFFF